MSWPAWYSKVWSRAGGSLDRVYAQVIHSLGSSRFFARGWGDLSLLNPDKFHRVLMKLEEHPVMRIEWQPVQTGVHRGNVFQVFEGKFASPAIYGVPNLPERCQQGRVWLMRPARDSMHPTAGMQGCVVQLAATGEHRQERRVLLAKRLLPSGIGTLILESPFYGSRKPPGQRGSKLLCVADLIKLGATTILEAVCLIWMLRKAGVLNICVAGWSMGAIHACMVASLTRFPVATAAIMPPRSASTAYCDGALSNFVDFHALRTARDAHGVPVLDTVSEMFSRRPNYPNTPSLFEHLSQQDQAAVQAAVTGAAKGAAPEAAAPPAQAEDQSSSDVHAWATQQTEVLDWPGGSFALEPRLPPLEDVQHAQLHHSEPSRAFLTSIPAASALTPQLQRFLSALSAVTVPLWRPKRGGQRAMQRRGLHSSSSRRRGTHGRTQRHRSVLRPMRGPDRSTSRSSSLSHRLRQQPQTLMHLKNVLTALQQASQLRLSRENSKVQRGRRRRKRNTAFAPTPSAQVMLPPCITVYRTTGSPGTFWDTMNQLLIAEIRHHLDAPFFSQESQGEKHSTATNAPSLIAGDTTNAAHEDQLQLHSRRPLEEAMHALPSSKGVQQMQPPADSLASDGPIKEASKGGSGLETPAGDEQLPPVAAYQRAIVKSMLRAAGIMAPRWPSRNPTTSNSSIGSSSSNRISDSGEGMNGSVTREPPSIDALTLQAKGHEGSLPSDSHGGIGKVPEGSLPGMNSHSLQGKKQPEASLHSESEHPHTHSHSTEHHQEAAHCQQAIDSHRSTPRSTEHRQEAVHSHSHHRGYRHGHPRRHSGSGSTSRTGAASGDDSNQGTSTSQEQLTSVTARYSKLLKKVVSGEYLLGESDELHSDDEGDTGSHGDGQAMSGATEASISQAGQELLLAITLEAFTDLSRYPRPQAPHAAVLVAAENDGYVSPHAVRAIHKHWTGSQLWRANGGHVSSFITLNSTFVRAVRDSLARLEATPTKSSTPATR